MFVVKFDLSLKALKSFHPLPVRAAPPLGRSTRYRDVVPEYQGFSAFSL